MGRYMRLSDKEVARIRHLYDGEQLPASVIAARTGLNKNQVYRIVGEAYRAEQKLNGVLPRRGRPRGRRSLAA